MKPILTVSGCPNRYVIEKLYPNAHAPNAGRR